MIALFNVVVAIFIFEVWLIPKFLISIAVKLFYESQWLKHAMQPHVSYFVSFLV